MREGLERKRAFWCNDVVLATHVASAFWCDDRVVCCLEANLVLCLASLFDSKCKHACVCGQDDATEAEWYDVTKLPPMAFDHKLIVRTAFEHLLQHSETKSTGMLL